MAERPTVSFKEGVIDIGTSSMMEPNAPPSILQFAFENAQGARIYKDYMDNHCVQIGDNPMDL